ncbi:MAG: hypothetical protein KF716_24105 [Anaerolineae bacterium]|nr:hypothetical protein [Anaerolineae bacterium]
MVRNLKAGEHVTVDRTVPFDPQSEPYEKGLVQVEPGQVGVVVSLIPQKRASVVDFSGIQATISHQRLVRAGDKPIGKKRGRKRKTDATAKILALPKSVSMNSVQSTLADATSEQLVTMIANTLLLNGGFKEEGDTAIRLRFADLPENVQKQIRSLIDAKLALSGLASRRNRD